jgi:hypothetical protein
LVGPCVKAETRVFEEDIDEGERGTARTAFPPRVFKERDGARVVAVTSSADLKKAVTGCSVRVRSG